MTRQVNATLLVQRIARGLAGRARFNAALRAQQQQQEGAVVRIQAAARGRLSRTEAAEADASRQLESGTFTIRNLDTGEATTVVLDDAEAEDKERLSSTLSLGTLQRGTEAWEAVRLECRGLLEKLASRSTLSFRSYQLCVWQERYVFAEDDALCYQELAQDRTPKGKMKRIPYPTIHFVGPYDETQFVLKCQKRSYTFLCPSTEARTRWIKNISMLTGCSASTEVCHKTTTMGH